MGPDVFPARGVLVRFAVLRVLLSLLVLFTLVPPSQSDAQSTGRLNRSAHLIWVASPPVRILPRGQTAPVSFTFHSTETIKKPIITVWSRRITVNSSTVPTTQIDQFTTQTITAEVFAPLA